MTVREFRNTVAMLGLALFVTLACSELALRVLAVAGVRVGLDLHRIDPAAVQIVPLGELGFRQKPGGRFPYTNGTAATANALGYRGPVVGIPKPVGTFRILLLGGSTTHGWCVSDTETIDVYMRQLLRERRPGAAVEVVNLAFDGYDSYQMLLRLRDDGLRFSPDLVIANAGSGDVANARFADLRDGDPRTLIWKAEVERLRAESARGRPTVFDIVKHWSYAARMPQYLRELRRARAATPGAARERVYPDAADYFERNIARLAGDATSHGAAVVLATEPSSLQALDATGATAGRRYFLVDAATTQAYRDTLAGRMEAVATRLAHAGQRVSYLRFDHVPREEFLDDAHLKATGNRTVATRLVDALLPLIPAVDAAPPIAPPPRSP